MNTDSRNTNPNSSSAAEITLADYEFVQSLLRKEIGFDLGNDRHYLIASRLEPIAVRLRYTDVAHLIHEVRRTQERRLIDAISEGMTINETSFFRGGSRLFDNLAQVVIPTLIPNRWMQRRLRVWCGACSTGQEPYSVLITLLEQCPQIAGWNIEIIATDISSQALDQARDGIYSHFEVSRGLSKPLLEKYFVPIGDRWQVDDSLRRRIEFHRHNLLDSFLYLTPPLDIIFLRNVLIYFEPSTKTELFQRLRQCMTPDGFLAIGETESTLGLTTDFHPNNVCRDFYQPVIS